MLHILSFTSTASLKDVHVVVQINVPESVGLIGNRAWLIIEQVSLYIIIPEVYRCYGKTTKRLLKEPYSKYMYKPERCMSLMLKWNSFSTCDFVIHVKLWLLLLNI